MSKKQLVKKIQTQEELIKIANRISAKVFSEEDNHKEIYEPRCNNNYFYFPAVSYFQSGTITPDMIEKLQSGGNMLSVGSGDGSLEKLISKGFKVPKDRIVVSDIKFDPKIKEHGFKAYQFDMLKDWPNFNEKFDYILFPESLGVAVMNIQGHPKTNRFYSTLEEDTKRILKGEQPKYHEFFLDLVSEDVPVVNAKYSIFKRALENLKPDGEIRVRWGMTEEQQRAYVMLKFQTENPKITFPEPNTGHNFTLKLSK